MPRQFARFQPAPIGTGQIVTSNGYEAASVSPTLQGHVRSTAPASMPQAGAEFVFYGDDTDKLRVVGLVDDAVSINAVPGDVAASIGWNLDAGELRAAGAVIAVAVEDVPLGEVAGVLLDQAQAPALVQFFHGDHLAVTAYLGEAITSPGVALEDDDGYVLLDDAGNAMILETVQ